jgi:hypothetical protein
VETIAIAHLTSKAKKSTGRISTSRENEDTRSLEEEGERDRQTETGERGEGKEERG